MKFKNTINLKEEKENRQSTENANQIESRKYDARKNFKYNSDKCKQTN